ncbi:MAG: hypothetical protein AABY22_06995 [Nanoarchaeota archaeon]
MPHKNPQKKKEYLKKYYQKNKEHWKLKAKKFIQNNPTYFQEYNKKHRNKAKEIYEARYRFKIKIKVIQKLGGQCKICGIKDIRVLEVNHINGGGSKETREKTNRFYIGIANGNRKIDDLELRCANHNIIYEYEQGRRGKYWKNIDINAIIKDVEINETAKDKFE